MKKRTPSVAPLGVILVLLVVSLACSDPIKDYLVARASQRDTATATMFTPTASNTATHRPTRTSTPSVTPTKSPTKTNTLAPTETPFPTDTLMDDSETPPVPGKRTLTQTGPASLQQDRFVETDGLTKFSYVPPAGWKEMPASGSSLTSWTGPIQKGCSLCSLVFNIEESKLSAEQAANEVLDSITPGSGVEIISQGKFANDAGLDAYKVVVVISSQGKDLQFVAHVFQKRGYLIFSLYLRYAEKNKEQDAIIDQCLKTLEYE